MLKWSFFLITSLVVLCSFCQNLVPNPSFEFYTESLDSVLENKNYSLLPVNAIYTDTLLKYSPNYGICQSWFRSGGWVTYEQVFLSEKYPNKYAYHGVNCKAHTGKASAFMKIGLGYPGKNGILYCPLSNSLIKDSLYNVSFWVWVRDTTTTVVFNNIGLAFSSDVPSNAETDIFDSYSLKNTGSLKVNNWSLIEGTYVATGTEHYLIIGKYRTRKKFKFRKGMKNSDPVMEINIDDIRVELRVKQL